MAKNPKTLLNQLIRGDADEVGIKVAELEDAINWLNSERFQGPREFLPEEKLAELTDLKSEEEFKLITQTLEQKGYDHYEISNFSLSGKYKTVFRPENPYPGLGLFTQNDNEVSGTFRKNTGDTRFLSGITFGDSILLSTFDGAHPYLIKAEKKGDTIFGNLHYYNDSITEFWMIEDQNYELADSKTLTKLKDGVQSINFNFNCYNIW